MQTDIVLAKLDTARTALAEAKTIQETKKILDVAAAAEILAKRQKLGDDAVQYATSIKVEALAQLGRMLKETADYEQRQKRGGDRKSKSAKDTLIYPPTLSDLGLDKRTSKLAQDIAALPEEQFQAVKEGVLSISKAQTAAKKKEYIENLESIKGKETKRLAGVYDVIIIDPPWQMEKIEREVAPNQAAFDYPTMTIEEIYALEIPTAADCHVFLWTTQKYLPFAFGIIAAWDLKYVCTFNWHKRGGFQVYGLPQYNNEFALYARKGSPKFVDTKDFFTSFEGKRGKHSEKPEEFYETIRRVTGGRRLDMFNRRKIKGFDGWGNEAE